MNFVIRQIKSVWRQPMNAPPIFHAVPSMLPNNIVVREHVQRATFVSQVALGNLVHIAVTVRHMRLVILITNASQVHVILITIVVLGILTNRIAVT